MIFLTEYGIGENEYTSLGKRMILCCEIVMFTDCYMYIEPRKVVFEV